MDVIIKAVKLNLLMFLFLGFEYFLIKWKGYKVKPSIVKITEQKNNSCRADLIFWILSQTIFPLLNRFGILWMFSVIGVLNELVLKKLGIHLQKGLLSDLFIYIENPYLIWLVWFITIDFTQYITHFLMHKITPLWIWHRFHHIVEDFSVLTSARFALSETIFGSLVRLLIVSFLLGLPDYQTITSLVVIKLLFEWMHHSNLPFDYGLLGNFFVSPRFHRFHHSKLDVDRDKNFGADLAIWDHLFGTVSKRYLQEPSLASEIPIGVKGFPDKGNLSRVLRGFVPELFIIGRVFRKFTFKKPLKF